MQKMHALSVWCFEESAGHDNERFYNPLARRASHKTISVPLHHSPTEWHCSSEEAILSQWIKHYHPPGIPSQTLDDIAADAIPDPSNASDEPRLCKVKNAIPKSKNRKALGQMASLPNCWSMQLIQHPALSTHSSRKAGDLVRSQRPGREGS